MMTYEDSLKERERILKSEPLGSKSLPKEEQDKLNEEYPMPSEEDIQIILKQVGC